MSIGFKAKYLVLEPVLPASVPNGTLFLDSSNGNQATIKNTVGVLEPVIGAGASSLFIKQMQAGEAIALNMPLSKRPDGKVIAADSDGTDTQNHIGFALEVAAADGDLINVLCVGANIVNAINGMGFTPGEDIFLDEAGGYTNTTAGFTGANDSIIKVGIADCAAGAASATAADLVVFSEVVLRP